MKYFTSTPYSEKKAWSLPAPPIPIRKWHFAKMAKFLSGQTISIFLPISIRIWIRHLRVLSGVLALRSKNLSTMRSTDFDVSQLPYQLAHVGWEEMHIVISLLNVGVRAFIFCMLFFGSMPVSLIAVSFVLCSGFL